MRERAAKGIPQAVEPGTSLLDVLCARRRVILGGFLVEQKSVLAHEVIEGACFALHRHLMCVHRVEAKESFLVVEDEQLKQRCAAVGANLDGSLLHKA